MPFSITDAKIVDLNSTLGTDDAVEKVVVKHVVDLEEFEDLYI